MRDVITTLAGLQARSAAMLFDPGGLLLPFYGQCQHSALTDVALRGAGPAIVRLLHMNAL